MGVLKNFDCSKVERDQAVDGNEEYNRVVPGMSYAGFCKSSTCVAFRHLVVVNREMGNHLVNDDIMSGLLHCPSCNTIFELEHVLMYKCRATVTVHLQQEQVSLFEAKGNEIVKLGCKAGGQKMILEGGLMTIEAKPLKGECSVS